MRHALLHQKDDLDRSITHLTEAVLLPFQPSHVVVQTFFELASDLLFRFVETQKPKPEDVKSSLKYFCYLRDNFHSLEAFDIPHDLFTSRLVRTMANNLMLGLAM